MPSMHLAHRVEGGGSEDNPWCLSVPFKTFLVHASCTRLAGTSPGDSVSDPHLVTEPWDHSHKLLLGIWTQVLTLAWRILAPLSHLSR